MRLNEFILVGRFPLGISCSPKTNIVVFYNKEIAIQINQQIDSPIFLYKHHDGFFVQVASQTNGCTILIHENDIDFLSKEGKPIDLYKIDVKPISK